MTEVQIPFMERFREPMLSGKKIWTSRTRQMGQPKDRFRAFGHEFIIISVEQKKLGTIANLFYDWEGCSSAKDFIEVWSKIHPRKRFQTEQLVWVHSFRRIDEVEVVMEE